MPESASTALYDIVAKHEETLLAEWLREQRSASSRRLDPISDSDVRDQSRELLELFRDALRSGDLTDIRGDSWTQVRELLASVSRSRTQQGFSPSEIAMFVFSLKQPIFELMRQHLEHDPARLATELWNATVVLDKLGSIRRRSSRGAARRSSRGNSRTCSSCRRRSSRSGRAFSRCR